jgi:hypothetical protein
MHRHQRSLYVPLAEDAVDALRELAFRELRDPRAQAAYLVLDGLRRAGALPAEPAATDRPSAAAAAVGAA